MKYASFGFLILSVLRATYLWLWKGQTLGDLELLHADVLWVGFLVLTAVLWGRK